MSSYLRGSDWVCFCRFRLSFLIPRQEGAKQCIRSCPILCSSVRPTTVLTLFQNTWYRCNLEVLRVTFRAESIGAIADRIWTGSEPEVNRKRALNWSKRPELYQKWYTTSNRVKTEPDQIIILTTDSESSSNFVRTLLGFSRLLDRTKTFISAVIN